MRPVHAVAAHMETEAPSTAQVCTPSVVTKKLLLITARTLQEGNLQVRYRTVPTALFQLVGMFPFDEQFGVLLLSWNDVIVHSFFLVR